MDTATDPHTSALRRDEGQGLWFLGSLAIIKASRQSTNGRVTVIEHVAPQGPGSPLHKHTHEDEWFYVIDGELTFWIGGKVTGAPAGSFVFGPRNTPHTFVVNSSEARFLLVTQPAGFEEFVLALSDPAQTLTLPPDSIQPPPPEDIAATAAEYGVEILGPPGIPS